MSETGIILLSVAIFAGFGGAVIGFVIGATLARRDAIKRANDADDYPHEHRHYWKPYEPGAQWTHVPGKDR